MSIESAVEQAVEAFAKSFETRVSNLDLDDEEVRLRVEARGQQWCYKRVCNATGCRVVRYPC